MYEGSDVEREITLIALRPCKADMISVRKFTSTHQPCSIAYREFAPNTNSLTASASRFDSDHSLEKSHHLNKCHCIWIIPADVLIGPRSQT